MASISSLMGTTSTSSSSSLYGTQNVISGLASGMDTESLIENSISGYKTKISNLQQEQQTVTWQQDAYRSLINKMVSMTQSYTSYTSKTNLYSASFFNKAVTTTATGANAAMVSATGKTSSAVQINAIKQLATAAKYTVGTGRLSTNSAVSGNKVVTTGEAIDWTKSLEISNVSGTMTINYGNKDVSIDFGELEKFTDAQSMADAITKKLSEQSVTLSSGTTAKADTLIDVSVAEDGTISFSDKKNAGNSVYIDRVYGKIAGTDNGLSLTTGKTATSFKVEDNSKLFGEANLAEYLSGKEMSFTIDGVTKKITIPDMSDANADNAAATFAGNLNTALTAAFGANKITVGISADQGLTFEVAKGSLLKVSSSAGEAIGLGKNGTTNYLDTSNSLGTLLGGFEGDESKDLVINGVTIGSFNKDTALETVMNAINGNTEAGVNVSYSKLTGQFAFTSSTTGAAGQIDMGTSGLAYDLFGEGNYDAGQDAIFTAEVNGQEMELTRSTNVVDLDGLSVSLKGTFGYEGDVVAAGTEAVSFKTESDADTIVDAIKSFVEDYNSLVTELRTTYAKQPAIKTDGSRYKPLTDDDKEDMTDSAISKYEEKAKQGVLFGDSDLSALYSKLRSIISPNGSNGSLFNSIGISTKYQDGLTTLSLDENELRSALETNPDKVRDAFVQTKDNGAATDGLMVQLKTTLDKYSSTSLASTGILVKRAGTPLSAVSLLQNTLQSQVDDLDKQIKKWQTKMSDKVDYYTKKFTALEQLISNMNNQSSMLSGMMGG